MKVELTDVNKKELLTNFSVGTSSIVSFIIKRLYLYLNISLNAQIQTRLTPRTLHNILKLFTTYNTFLKIHTNTFSGHRIVII